MAMEDNDRTWTATIEFDGYKPITADNSPADLKIDQIKAAARQAVMLFTEADRDYALIVLHKTTRSHGTVTDAHRTVFIDRHGRTVIQ
jgi:hypothetical protein